MVSGTMSVFLTNYKEKAEQNSVHDVPVCFLTFDNRKIRNFLSEKGDIKGESHIQLGPLTGGNVLTAA